MPEGQYPDDWDEIAQAVKEEAGWRCECTGECALHRGQRCTETHGTKAQFANGDVVLTVAHLNHHKADCRRRNLLAMCQTCHLRYDLTLHARNAFAKRSDHETLDLFEDAPKLHPRRDT